MEWKTVKLGEVITIKYGKDHKALGAGSIPVYGSGGIMRYADKAICDKPSILIPRKGSLNNIFYVNKPFWTVDTMFWSIIDTEKADPHFLFYAICKLDFAGLNVGSAVPSLTVPVIEAVELALPPLETQRRIAAILSSFDDKIENNNRINRNLEAQAQALFKSWFEDFEPFGGVMPEDWKEGTYSDIIESTISGDWGKERAEGNYTHSVACIRGCDFEDMNNGVRGKTPQRYILEKNYQNKGLKNRDIVVEISGGTATVSTGRVCLITEKLLQKYDYDIVCTNFCRTIRPLADYYTYLYYSWKYKYDQKIMFGYENGTSGIKNFAVKDFIEKEPLIIPSCDIVKSFNMVISVLHDKIQENGTESQRLAALRDTLLPKLMRGEITL